jgi:hypothetical protein
MDIGATGTTDESHADRTSYAGVVHDLDPHHPEQNSNVMPFDVLCRHFGISDSNRAAAILSNDEKSLFAMVTNHRAMIRILMTFGLYDPASIPFVRTARVVCNGVPQLSGEEILRRFEWSPDSFMHKLRWFSWAEEAAWSSQWANLPAPGMSLALFTNPFQLTKCFEIYSRQTAIVSYVVGYQVLLGALWSSSDGSFA